MLEPEEIRKAFGVKEGDDELIMHCAEEYKDYDDFVNNSSFAKNLNDDELDNLDEKFLLEEKACATIGGIFVYFNWLDYNYVTA